jgi:pimeloyl-ACP methyl ester carboxylesterase
VGHSLGALIGIFLAAVHPQRINTLTLLDAGGKLPDDTLAAIAASLARLGTVYPSLDAYLDMARGLPVHEWNPLWEAYYRYDAEVHPDGTVTPRAQKHAIAEENAVTFSTRTDLLTTFIQQPTLLVRATLGTLGPDRGFVMPRAEAERLLAELPRAQLVEIPDTNHYTLVTSPLVAPAITEFLDAHALASLAPGAGAVPEPA